MKCVKLNFKDILFYAPNWSDEKGTSYGRFSGFLSHKIEISENKNILGTSLEKSKTTHVAKKIPFHHTLARIVRCRIARSLLIPLYLPAVRRWVSLWRIHETVLFPTPFTLQLRIAVFPTIAVTFPESAFIYSGVGWGSDNSFKGFFVWGES